MAVVVGAHDKQFGAHGKQWGPTRTGHPEVDRIIDGSKFKNFPIFSPLNYPDKIRIREYRELAAEARANSTSPPLPNLDNVDRISKLPDDILKFIISLLTMREAAATSLLSPRWRNLWTISLSCLNFDIPNMLGHDYPNIIFSQKTQDYRARKMLIFTKWVNRVIKHFFCHASRLDALRVCFILNEDSTPDIDRWIMSSLARGVTEIHLDFNYNKFFGDVHYPDKFYVFHAQQVASTIRYLHLKSCKIHLPPDFTGFTSLVRLSLFDIFVTKTLMEDVILSKCPLLEFLSMERCYHPYPTYFEFVGTSFRLKHLNIAVTDNVESIKVHNVNLLSFELKMDVPKVSIENAPRLARLVLNMTNHKSVDTVTNIPLLETLFLEQHNEKISDVSWQPYIFNNLKQLVFLSGWGSTNLLGVVHILEACHLLEKLELDMGITRKTERSGCIETVGRLTALPGFPHNNLKEIEIYGFEVYPEKIALAVYLLDNAVVLQKMKLYTISKIYCGDGRWEDSPEYTTKKTPLLEKVHKARFLKKVHKELQDIAHSSTKVELFSYLNM